METTKKELLDTVKLFDMLFDMSNKVKPGINGLGCVVGIKQEETQQRIMNQRNEAERWKNVERHLKPYSFEFPLTFKEFDTYYILTKDIVGLDKSLLHLKVEGLKATLEYNNSKDTRRTKFNYRFELPEISDLDNITINYVDGELKIVVPKLSKKIKHYTVQ